MTFFDKYFQIGIQLSISVGPRYGNDYMNPRFYFYFMVLCNHGDSRIHGIITFQSFRHPNTDVIAAHEMIDLQVLELSQSNIINVQIYIRGALSSNGMVLETSPRSFRQSLALRCFLGALLRPAPMEHPYSEHLTMRLFFLIETSIYNAVSRRMRITFVLAA